MTCEFYQALNEETNNTVQQNTSKFMLRGLQYLGHKRILCVSLSHKYRCKNLQQNISKLNQAICKKDLNHDQDNFILGKAVC